MTSAEVPPDVPEGPETLPLVPLRDQVVFPQQVAPLAVGRPKSLAALEAAGAADGRVVLAVQRVPETEDVAIADLYAIAVVANVGAYRRAPNGGAQALVEGQRRVVIDALQTDGSAWTATVHAAAETSVESSESEALVQSVRSLFGEYVAAGAQVTPDFVAALGRSHEAARIVDLLGAVIELPQADRLTLLLELDVVQRLRLLVPLLAKQVEVAQLRSRIHADVRATIDKSQREHILREQLRALRKELADLEGQSDEEDLTARVEATGMPDAVKQRALKEVSRLEQIPSASPELGMLRTYIDWLLELPWGEPPPEDIDIERAQAILDEDHYGLTKVKDRILEWMAVRQRARQKLERRAAATRAAEEDGTEPAPSPAGAPTGGGVTGNGASSGAGEGDGATLPSAEREQRRALQTPILCFVGPPGVGKTSLGRSIARALDRKFVRLSLGGIRDEAEIRGHRRTYIGALPGRIIQSMRTAGSRNPVIMMDEIDKVGADFRGDPASGLLEVLDPEQNREFSDHYLEVPYDLSHVLFITTANIVETIHPALRDRMEIIRINGYTEEEKVGIAERHLIPKQLEQHGLDDSELTLTREALVSTIRGWTREAGVRQLDRTIAQIARKVPRKLVAGEAESIAVTPDDLAELLGPQRFEFGEAESEDQVGAATGVVVSEVGGDITTVEALALEGRSDLLLTGQLGNVMEESARAALSWARVHGERYGVPRGYFDNHGMHIHVPSGAIPKDGPSAGVTMTTAVVSAASGRPVRRDVAMTGEITLRGRVLPIGGVKDKLLAAHRAGIPTFLLPRKNLPDLSEVDKEILERVHVVAVDTIDEVLEHALRDAAQRPHRRVGFAAAATAS